MLRLILLGTAAALVVPAVECFVSHPSFLGAETSRLFMVDSGLGILRKNIELPLLDLSGDSEVKDRAVFPLPSDHLPDDLTTLNMYGIHLSRPVHKMMLDEVTQKAEESPEEQRVFGFIAQKESDDSLVGAIGCTAEVLISARQQDEIDESEIGKDAAVGVMYRGCYRFVVKEVVKSFPYPVAIVDELVDEDDGMAADDALAEEADADDDEGSENESFDVYANISIAELNQRIMESLETYIDQKLKGTQEKKELSPLEISILESNGLPLPDDTADRDHAEEMAAVFSVFKTSLLANDIGSTPKERNYALAMMAAEMTNTGNEVRKEILATTNSADRLRIVCRVVEQTIGLNQAKNVAKRLSEEAAGGGDLQELQVGPPQLPSWASQIKKGTLIEYYWNDEWEWCSGEVCEDPFKIMDELIIPVRFDADGEIHKLPLNPDEKVRWRPNLDGNRDTRSQEDLDFQ